MTFQTKFYNWRLITYKVLIALLKTGSLSNVRAAQKKILALAI